MKFNLNKIAIYFLKNVLLIFGIVLIGILVYPFPLIIVKLFNSDLVIRTYLLIGIFSIYLIAVPFIYSLFLSFKILNEIEKWRELLARNIALRNPTLSQRELNFAVQQTIDRIVFLRICEDRGMVKYNYFFYFFNRFTFCSFDC